MNRNNRILLIIALCGMAGCSIGVCLNSTGVFFNPIAESFNAKRGTVAMFSTILAFTSAIGAVILPLFINNRNFKKLYIAGSILSVIAVLLLANSQSIMMLYVGGFLFGLGSSTYSVVMITTIINSTITENVGTITGLVFSFAGVIGAVFSPLFANIIAASSWRVGFYVMAVLVAVQCLPGVFVPLNVERTTADSQTGRKFNYLTVAFMSAAAMSAMYSLLPPLAQHLPGIVSSKGLDGSRAPFLVTVAMISNIVFKLAAGVLVDKLKAMKTLLIMTVGIIISIMFMWFGGSITVIGIGAAFFGSIYAICSVVNGILVKEVFGIDNYKQAYSVVSFAGSVTNALAISMIGYVYDFTGSYSLAFILAIILSVCGYLAATNAKKKHLGDA